MDDMKRLMINQIMTRGNHFEMYNNSAGSNAMHDYSALYPDIYGNPSQTQEELEKQREM